MRKNNVDEINLNIEEVTFFSNTDYKGIDIAWTSDIGFGHLSIFQQHGKDEILVDTEHMDSQDDKAFTKKLLELLMDKLVVIG